MKEDNEINPESKEASFELKEGMWSGFVWAAEVLKTLTPWAELLNKAF